jgi:DNA-directed RNA polymerase specialized sigma24 family protein
MDKVDRFVEKQIRPLFNDLADKANLNDEEREVFYQREFLKWSLVKVSMALPCSESTAKRRYRSARRKLNKAL